uniref:Rep protein n=1 Tax=Chicken circovirus 3 TaxID=2735305 RepID=A0A6M8DNK2_9CIRC|nr:Rep protein [Chicken circovirus 3]
MNSTDSTTEFLGNNEPKTHARKQGTAVKNYVFTKFLQNSSEEPEFRKSLELICEEFQYSHEICPTTNRTHLQGQMSLTKRMRITQIVKYKHLNMYLAIQKGSQLQNDIYIMKNTNNLVKWKKPKVNLSKNFKDEINELSMDELFELFKKLILKNFTNKDEQEYHSRPIEFIHVFDPEHQRAVLTCLILAQFYRTQEKKTAVKILDKYT